MPKYSLVVSILLAAFAAHAQAVSIGMIPIGNAGNVADQDYVGEGHFGSVPNTYQIGATEVTNAQYAEFLNAKGVSDPFGLYNTEMGSNARGGIARSGVSGSFTYAPRTNMGDKPVNFVSWFDSVRFANWLNNGQGSGNTEVGAYTVSEGASVVRQANANWFLPNENEWYKAAYFDPRNAAQGGPAGDDHYWYYATASDSDPTMATANSNGDISNPGPNVANFAIVPPLGTTILTTVGSAGPLSTSFFGTSDQAGNVSEWTESPYSDTTIGPYRVRRGGAFFEFDLLISAEARVGSPQELERADIGFRVATLVPEPSSFVLAAVGIIGLVVWRRRKQ